MKVFVTGLGVVSALGIGVEANFSALEEEATGIKLNTLLNGLFVETYVGELPIANAELHQIAGFTVNKAIPRTALLGVIAAKEALGSALLDNSLRTGFINGSTVGGMDLTENYFSEFMLKENHEHFRLTATHDLGTVTNIIAQTLGAPLYINTISTACSSSANSIMLGTRMIKAGIIDRVIVGGSDAIARFTINGFRSLMIYDNEICQPFDQNRRGLNLGEGAGYLLLENDTSLEKSNNEVVAEITGWHNANDAYHQTGTSPEGDGAMKAMKGALEITGFDADKIDYVNAHGTATPNNDQSESNALKRIFKNKKVNFSSTKGFTGHTLGASGGIEAVYSLLALKNQSFLPNLGLSVAMDEAPNLPVTSFTKNITVTNVMSNSFGFGGNSTSLIFSKP